MKNILIVQNYNANKGDSSVVLAMLSSLRACPEGSNLSFAVTSYDPVAASIDYKVMAADFAVNLRDIKLNSGVRRIFDIAREGCWILYGTFWALIRRFCGLRLPVPGFKRATIDLYESADIVILPGGHFFTNFNGVAMNFSHFYAMMLAFAMRKKTMIYAQTIGPFFGPWKLLVKFMTDFVLRFVDLVTLREKGGIKYCRNVKQLQQTAEIVFAMDTQKQLAQSVPELIEARKKGKLLVGVTIHHIYYKHFFSKDQYRDVMADIFRKIVDDYHATILVVPMESAVHGGGDRPMAQEIIEQSKRQENAFILEGDLETPVTASVISGTDIFIGTKTHSIVYGLKGGVPTISISYQDKSNQFMEMFGLRENAIDMKDLNSEQFMIIFDKVFNSISSYQNKQEKAFREIKFLAETNNHLLVDLLRR